MIVDDFLQRLELVRPRGTGQWSARCPAHADKSPSLSVGKGSDRILIHCFALCEPADIVEAMGLRLSDLFFNAPTPHGQRPNQNTVKIDRVAVAFQFGLCALDHRLRAERIFSTASKVTPAQLNDNDLDHALALIERGHKDIAQAEFLNRVANNLRMKEFLERDHEQKRRVA